EAKALFKPEQVVWCDGSKEEYQRLLKSLGDGGTAKWLNPQQGPHSLLARPREAPELDPGALRSQVRRPRRGPDLHLLGEEGRRSPDQQLVRPEGDEGEAPQAL